MEKWIQQWNTWVAPTKLPGVWKTKTEAYLVRARVKDPTTGKLEEIRRVLDARDEVTDEVAAFNWLQNEKNRVKSGITRSGAPKPRFADYAVSLLQRKLEGREIRSARGRERWVYTLRHLIAGTQDVAGFGDYFMEQIRPMHAETWRAGVGGLITSGKYSPNTVNGWIGILRHIGARATRELELAKDPFEGLRIFDTSEHDDEEEDPNTLTPEQLPPFLACMFEEFPAHYAMTYLGFSFGPRPSHLRPLRRQGPTPDVLWDDGIILLRRSHTLGTIIDRTKTKRRARIHLPTEAMDVLRWHVQTQLITPEQRDSELLFPAEDGRPRSEGFLGKPFAAVSEIIGLPFKLTPKGMRRVFSDNSRLIKMDDIVRQSLGGWESPRVRKRYSTVMADEQRASIRQMMNLAATKPEAPGLTTSGTHGGTQGPLSGTHLGTGTHETP